MQTSLALVKITYFDDFDNETRVQYCVFSGRDIEELGAEIDQWIGKDLISCEIMPLENGPLILTEDMYGALMRENI